MAKSGNSYYQNLLGLDSDDGLQQKTSDAKENYLKIVSTQGNNEKIRQKKNKFYEENLHKLKGFCFDGQI